MTPFTAIIPHFYPSRTPYLERIIKTLQAADVSEIILWDDGNILDPFAWNHDRVRLVQTNEPARMRGWMAATMLAKTDIVYVQANDLIAPPESIRVLVDAAESYRGCIVGPIGMNVDMDAPEPYDTRQMVASGPCDLMVGRLIAFHKSALIRGLKWLFDTGTDPGHCDDIIMSMCGRAQRIPVPFTSLEEHSEGMSHMPNHFAERNAMVRRLSRMYAYD